MKLGDSSTVLNLPSHFGDVLILRAAIYTSGTLQALGTVLILGNFLATGLGTPIGRDLGRFSSGDSRDGEKARRL